MHPNILNIRGWRFLYIVIFVTETRHSNAECPDKCSCSLSHELNCSNKSFKTLLLRGSMGNNKYTVLNVSFNNIKVLEDKRLMELQLPALNTVDFTGNGLTEIQPNAFEGMEGISEELFLAGNELTDLPENVFLPLKDLKRLDLHNNKLNKITPNTFSPLKELQILDLRNNNIHFIENKTFAGLTKLRKLYLYGNMIENFFPEMFECMGGLKVLELQFMKRQGRDLLPQKTGKLTHCLCERIKGLEWCQSRNITCKLTCDYSQEAKFEKTPLVCNNSLPNFDSLNFNRVNIQEHNIMSTSDLIWACVITVGVLSLLIITLIMLAVVVCKAKGQNIGDDDCSDFSEYETFHSYITNEESRWSNKNEGSKKKPNE